MITIKQEGIFCIEHCRNGGDLETEICPAAEEVTVNCVILDGNGPGKQ